MRDLASQRILRGEHQDRGQSQIPGAGSKAADTEGGRPVREGLEERDEIEAYLI